MRMNAYEILDMDIIDAVLEEGEGSASANPDFAIANVVAYVEESLDELSALPVDELLEQRYERFHKFYTCLRNVGNLEMRSAWLQLCIIELFELA